MGLLHMLEFSTLKIEDKESVFDLLQDAIVMKYIGPRRPLSKREADDWFQSELDSPTRYTFRCLLTKEIVGFCGIKDINGTPDFGYFIRKKYWGNGYAKCMCKMVIKKLGSNFNFSEINVFIASGNIASENLAKSLGWSKKTVAKNEYETGFLYEIHT